MRVSRETLLASRFWTRRGACKHRERVLDHMVMMAPEVDADEAITVRRVGLRYAISVREGGARMRDVRQRS